MNSAALGFSVDEEGGLLPQVSKSVPLSLSIFTGFAAVGAQMVLGVGTLGGREEGARENGDGELEGMKGLF